MSLISKVSSHLEYGFLRRILYRITWISLMSKGVLMSKRRLVRISPNNLGKYTENLGPH